MYALFTTYHFILRFLKQYHLELHFMNNNYVTYMYLKADKAFIMNKWLQSQNHTLFTTYQYQYFDLLNNILNVGDTHVSNCTELDSKKFCLWLKWHNITRHVTTVSKI